MMNTALHHPLLLAPISGEESLSLLCEVLSALGNTKPGVLKPILPDICHAMASVAQSSSDDLMEGGREGEGEEAAKKRVLTLLAAMLFQTLKGHRWTPDAEQVSYRYEYVPVEHLIYQISYRSSYICG